jgi:chemosensory pili system protein ChpA (sensor histidine kinase/response regulator)
MGAGNPNAGLEAISEVADKVEFLKLTFDALVLNGASMVAEEMITLCEQLKQYKVEKKEAAYSAMMDVVVVLPAYLDRMQAGHQDLPILLLPVINGLRSAHNATLLQESAVFAPDLDQDLPELNVAPQEPTRDESFSDFAIRMRQQYENALLNWLQEQDILEHLSPLQGVCETLLHRCTDQDLRRLWWVASEVIGGLTRKYARNDASLRRLFARLHLVLKTLSEDGEAAVGSRLTRSLTRAFLFQIAGSRKGNPGIDQLKEHFQLKELMPDQDELLRAKGAVTGRDRDMYASLGSAIQDELSLVKDALDLELRTGQVDRQRRDVSVDALNRLQDTLKMLGLQEPAQALGNILPAFLDSEDGDREARESSLMSLASQLLLIESALNEQIETLGEPLSEEENTGLIDLPPHEQRRIRDHLLEEMVTSVTLFQEAVKSRFGGDSRVDLDEHLQQVAGALQLIDEKVVAELTLRLSRITSFLLKNAFAEAAVPKAHLESFTDAVAALELYLSACRDHQSNQNRFVEILEASLNALPESKASAQQLAEQSARDAAQAEASKTPSAIKTVEIEPASASGMESLPAEMDAELLEVFLEEYESVAESMNNQIPLWLENLEDVESLTEIRRGFHTLKGSGRMVGAFELGDFCWQIEDLLNALLDRKIDVYADVAVMVRLAQAALPALKQRLMQQVVGLSQQAIKSIGDHAERLTRGEGADWGTLHHQLPAYLAGMLPGSPGPDHFVAADSPKVDARTEGLRKDLVENLQPVRDLLEQVSNDRTVRATRDHLRAVHTLAGALAMAPENREAEIARALEGMLEAQSNSGGKFGLEAVWALGSAIEHLQSRLDRLEGQSDASAPEDEQGLIDQIISITVELETLEPDTSAPMPDPEAAAAQTEILEPGTEEPGSLEKEIEDLAAEVPGIPPEPEIQEEVQEDTEGLDSEIINIFLEEAHEVLGRSDTLLNTWRDELDDLSLVQNLQREIHTFKGGARMAGLSALGDLSHAMESLLERIAARSLPPSVSAIQALETGCDHLQSWVAQVANFESPRVGSAITLFEQQVQDLVDVPLGTPGPAMTEEEPREAQELPEVTPVVANRSDEKSGAQIRVNAELLDSLVNAAGEVSIFRSRLEQQIGNLRSSLGEFDDTIARVRDQFRKLEIETEAQIRSRFQDAGEQGTDGFDPLELDRFSSMQQLSRGLSESVSDLLNLQELLDDAARQSDSLLTQQSRFTSELQEGLMQTRMVHFGTVAPRLRRLVRSAANQRPA